MKRFLLLCKRQLKQPVFLFLCFFLPVSCLLIKNLEQDSRSSLCVGLFVEDEDAFTAAFLSDLTSAQSSITFERYSDRNSMTDKVARNELDCAYVFESGLHSRLLDNDYKNSILCYISPSTIMADLSREIVFSALFRQLGNDIAVSSITDSALFGAAPNQAADEVSDLYEKYLNGSEVFALNYQYLNTISQEPADTAAAAAVMPVRGFIAVFLFISGLAGGVACLSDREQKLPVPALCSILIPLLFMTLSSCLTLFLTGEAGSWSGELAALLLYLILITVFVRFLLLFIKKPEILTACIPILTLGSLIFCPIFINLGIGMPFFKIMEKLFPPYYYLTGFSRLSCLFSFIPPV